MADTSSTSSPAPRVLIVGAGGLGTSAAWGLLAGWPAGKPLELHVYDPDVVELSNLNRQVLFHESDIGRPKAAALCERLAGVSGLPEKIALRPFEAAVDRQTIAEAARSANIVIDASDSTGSKFLLNDFCVSERIPLCYGGATADIGQCMLIDSRAGGPCLRCVFGDLSAEEAAAQTGACRREGIFGPVVGMIGFLQAEAALCRLFPERSSPAKPGLLLRCRLSAPVPREHCFTADPGCPLACGRKARHRLDVRDKHCPETFLYTKLALERLGSGELLDVRLGTEETLHSVVQSAVEEGYRVSGEPRLIAEAHWRVVMGRVTDGSF